MRRAERAMLRDSYCKRYDAVLSLGSQVHGWSSLVVHCP
jgi:hypothetical protein